MFDIGHDINIQNLLNNNKIFSKSFKSTNVIDNYSPCNKINYKIKLFGVFLIYHLINSEKQVCALDDNLLVIYRNKDLQGNQKDF